MEPKIPSSNPAAVPDSPRKEKKKKGTRLEIVVVPKPVAELAPDMEELLKSFVDVFHNELPKGLLHHAIMTTASCFSKI